MESIEAVSAISLDFRAVSVRESRTEQQQFINLYQQEFDHLRKLLAHASRLSDSPYSPNITMNSFHWQKDNSTWLQQEPRNTSVVQADEATLGILENSVRKLKKLD